MREEAFGKYNFRNAFVKAKPETGDMVRSVLDVYIAPVLQIDKWEKLIPQERENELQATGNETLKLNRYTSWHTLEYAFSRSFGKSLGELELKRNEFGKWTCKTYFLSLSHTNGYVAAAVSDAGVGVDIENAGRFLRKNTSDSVLEHMFRKICSNDELERIGSFDSSRFLTLWTKKESIYKATGLGDFSPQQADTGKSETVTFYLDSADLLISVCGKSLGALRVYMLDGGTAHILGRDELESRD